METSAKKGNIRMKKRRGLGEEEVVTLQDDKPVPVATVTPV